jgi:hypothetical protein
MLAQANEEEARKQWAERVEALQMEMDLREIEAAAARFRELRGRYPSSLGELAASGILARVPKEPHGGAYLLRPDGTAASTKAERLRVYGGFARLEVH